MWQTPVHIPETVTGGASVNTLAHVDGVDEDSTSDSVDTPGTPMNNTVWPSDTDLKFTPGTNKVSLTLQRPLIRVIVQDAFENFRAALLFDNAFPDAGASPGLILAALVAAAESRGPRATHIHKRLLCDVDYVASLSRLVSSDR